MSYVSSRGLRWIKNGMVLLGPKVSYWFTGMRASVVLLALDIVRIGDRRDGYLGCVEGWYGRD